MMLLFVSLFGTFIAELKHFDFVIVVQDRRTSSAD